MRKGVLIVLLLFIMPIVLADYDDYHYLMTDSKRMSVIEVDSEGTVIWDYKCSGTQCHCGKDNCQYGFDSATRLANGNTLLIDNVHNKLLEIDVEGNTVWRYGDGKIGSFFNQMNHPKNAIRLPNGNMLVADSGNNRIIEIEPSKAVEWEYGCDNKYLDCDANVLFENLKNPSSATMTSEGNVLIADTDNDRVIEVNKNNEIVWGFGCTAYDLAKKCGSSDYNLFRPTFAVRLENTTLIADGGNNRVVEVSKEGEIIWRYGSTLGKEWNELNFPKSAVRLKNGNILVADSGNNRVVEIDKLSKEIVFRYSDLLNPSFAEVPAVNYERIRDNAPGCSQKNQGFEVEYETSVQPKYTYAVKKGSEKKIYLMGKYESEKFVSTDDKIVESGQYTLFAAYEEETRNHSMYCKLDKLICNAINLSINSCYLKDGIVNISFSGIGEQSRFLNFNDMFLYLKADEKTWDDFSGRACGEKPNFDLQRFGMGSYVKNMDNGSYNFVAPIGQYNIRLASIVLGECCESDLSGIMIYPRTKSVAKCEVMTLCKADADCDDELSETMDWCSRGVCKNENKSRACISDLECNDYTQCTIDSCMLGKCIYTSECTGCNYCSIDGKSCITNETCLSSLETVPAELKSESVIEKITESDTGLKFLPVLLLLALAVASSLTVFFVMKRKLDAEIEKEKKLEYERKEPAVVRNLTPEQVKGIQDVVGNDQSRPEIKNAYVKKEVEDAKITPEINTSEEGARHVRQAFPGTILPGKANADQKEEVKVQETSANLSGEKKEETTKVEASSAAIFDVKKDAEIQPKPSPAIEKKDDVNAEPASASDIGAQKKKEVKFEMNVKSGEETAGSPAINNTATAKVQPTGPAIQIAEVKKEKSADVTESILNRETSSNPAPQK